jgi:pyruvate-ferredoxin/flavodoxin oxidoreductase
MGKTQEQTKKAVDAGYWHLYRYNPDLELEGKNPFVLDSKEPKADFKEYLMSEVRYASLTKTFPEMAEQLFEKAEMDAKKRYEIYKQLAEMGNQPVRRSIVHPRKRKRRCLFLFFKRVHYFLP